MKMPCAILACLPCLLAAPLLAQPQIGGGTCNSSTLSGTYSLTLTGRDVSSSVVFVNAQLGIGSATFDGLSGVTFTLTNNSNKFAGVAQTLSGTYSLQSNCIGVLNIATGDTASFNLASYDSGSSFLITGQDAVYSFTGSGTKLPASCSVSMLSGIYAFNGNGYSLGSSGIAGVNYISGLLTFDGTKAVTGTWYVTTNGSSQSSSTSGSYTVTSNCTANATLTDSAGNAYILTFTITSSTGSNFIVSGSNAQIIFTGSGRTL